MSVFTFEDQDIITIKENSLDKLREAAQSAPLRRSRYCLHKGNEDRLHEMVICFCQDSYVRPHKHINKSESFHIIEGKLQVVFLDDNGLVTQRLNMSPFKENSDEPFLYRLASDLWHTVIPLTEFVVIHEITNGPFIKEEGVFPDWAPEDGDRQGINEFLARIRE